VRPRHDAPGRSRDRHTRGRAGLRGTVRERTRRPRAVSERDRGSAGDGHPGRAGAACRSERAGRRRSHARDRQRDAITTEGRAPAV